MTCRIMDIETGIRFRTNGRKVTAPQVIAEKITHRLIDGEKEESFAVRLSRAGDEENHGDKKIAKGDDRLSDGTMNEKENPPLYGGREREAVAATLYAATLLLVNKQRDRKGRAVLCSRFFLGLGSPRALRSCAFAATS